MSDLSPVKNGLMTAFANVTNAKGMGAFILAFCYIDYLASYYYGRDTDGDDYKAFVKRYLPSDYIPEDLWRAGRCGLVHNYTDRGNPARFDFREDAESTHLQVRPVKGAPAGTTLRVLNLQNFRNDLERATNDFFKTLDTNPEMARRALERYKTVGLIAGSVETD